MIRLSTLLVFVLVNTSSFSQWTRVTELPASDIFSVYQNGDTLYAGGRDRVYLTMDHGETWDSSSVIPAFVLTDNIIVFKNELYVASSSGGVYKSRNNGETWINISAGIFPYVSDLCIFRDDLYASTYGSSVFKLDPASRNRWLPFSTGLSQLSANTTSIAGTKDGLVAGALANALYDYLPPGSAVWEELFLLGRLSPSEGVYDIITAHDTLFLSGRSGMFYTSTNNGLDWNIIADRIRSNYSPLLNTQQALILARATFNGLNNTTFYYLNKNALKESFVEFSFIPDHFTYKTAVAGGKLWDASTGGLFYMSLAELPGISEAVPDTPIVFPISLNFFKANCVQDAVELTWKTARELNSGRFDIERSRDGSQWLVIGSVSAAGNSINELEYSFRDNRAGNDYFYRIATYDQDGKAQYSLIEFASCATETKLTVLPNPAHDQLQVLIKNAIASPIQIELFDSKGAVIVTKYTDLHVGTNRVVLDISAFPTGIYFLRTKWNFGKESSSTRILKL